jgi:hypothetical protein
MAAEACQVHLVQDFFWTLHLMAAEDFPGHLGGDPSLVLRLVAAAATIPEQGGQVFSRAPRLVAGEADLEHLVEDLV